MLRGPSAAAAAAAAHLPAARIAAIALCGWDHLCASLVCCGDCSLPTLSIPPGAFPCRRGTVLLVLPHAFYGPVRRFSALVSRVSESLAPAARDEPRPASQVSSRHRSALHALCFCSLRLSELLGLLSRVSRSPGPLCWGSLFLRFSLFFTRASSADQRHHSVQRSSHARTKCQRRSGSPQKVGCLRVLFVRISSLWGHPGCFLFSLIPLPPWS